MKWIGFLFHNAPFSLPVLLLQEGISSLLHIPLKEGRLDFWENKVIGIRIEDLGIVLNFTKKGNRILEVKSALPQVSISGTFKAFMLLVARKSDPDTLFFQRKLLVEGDTALGLEIKNFLDSLEIDSLPAPMRLAYQFFAKML